ncbi:Protein of unknown function [Yoonia litorea]|uniref:DUF3726 domain-containing protein n=2 Tax=Yoonia litorea TaxID=1123755 RepID=A0A1I6MXE0_9RHOB|nr:Protein of unknown function [Yoonia litorea]
MLSLNEVGGIVLKAGRGAGLPLGQAEDLAAVATYLLGISGKAKVITNALQEPISEPQIDWQDDRVVVQAGSASMIAPIIRDAFLMGYDSATLSDLSHVWLVGAALANDRIALQWDGLHLSRSDTEVLRPKTGPVSIPADDWDVWSALAAKTYVPESDASRLAGAGAGLTDND